MTDDLDRAIKHFYQDAGRLVRDARLRTKPRITQAQLAAAVCMTRSSIANLEAGRQRIPLHVLVWIAEVLAVEPATLLPDRPMFNHLTVIPDLEERLADVPEGMRNFVQGAIAKLAVSSRKGA